MTLPKQPLVSIDTVPFLFRDGVLGVVLAERIFEPFTGQPALPGVLLSSNERLAEAAVRALETKAGIGAGYVLSITGAGVYDNPDRDPRGPTLSIVHALILDPRANLNREGVSLVPAAEVKGLPFDHDAIVARTAGALLDTLWVDAALTRALLGERFTTATAARLTRELAAAAGRKEPDSSNLGRMLARNPALSKSGAAVASGRGRPAAGWIWL